MFKIRIGYLRIDFQVIQFKKCLGAKLLNKWLFNNFKAITNMLKISNISTIACMF